jgi:SAM-dependent methyltransferase
MADAVSRKVRESMSVSETMSESSPAESGAAAWERTKALFESGAEGPSITLGPYFSFIVRRSPRRLLHMLSYYKFAAKMIGPRRRVLEVGCSEGFGTVLLAEAASEVVALDFDADAIAVANATLAGPHLRFVQGDATKMSLGVFDAAVTLDTIEHVPHEQEREFVAGIAAQLQRRGVAIIGTPNETSDRYASAHTRAGHINLFSAPRLEALCADHFENVFLFSANDELVHTGFAPMAHYLLALCVAPRSESR